MACATCLSTNDAAKNKGVPAPVGKVTQQIPAKAAPLLEKATERAEEAKTDAAVAVKSKAEKAPAPVQAVIQKEVAKVEKVEVEKVNLDDGKMRDFNTFFRVQLQEKAIAKHNMEKHSNVTQDLLNDLLACQQATTAAYLSGKCKVDFEDESLNCLSEPRGALAELNKTAWSHQICEKDGTFVRQLNDLDCMLITMRQEEISKNKKASSTVHLVDMDLDVTLMQATMGEGAKMQEYNIVRSEKNDRTRAPDSQKSNALFFNQEVVESGKFGTQWLTTKGKNRYPTLTQVTDGLRKYHAMTIASSLKNMTKDKNKKVTKQYEDVFAKILELGGLDKAGNAAPLAANYGKLAYGRMFPIKEGLFDPDNKATQLILWLYSMEPSFYADLHRITRDMEEQYVDVLGPFALCMYWITKLAEMNRVDKMTLGVKVHRPDKGLEHELGYFASSYCVFKGAQMMEDWVQDWKNAVGQMGLKNAATGEIEADGHGKPGAVHMQGISCASDNLRVALKQAQCPSDGEHVPVVFVISLQNYGNFSGFRANSELYSAHANEQEILLKEGAQMWVMKVDSYQVEDVTTADSLYQAYAGRVVTFIHLCKLG